MHWFLVLSLIVSGSGFLSAGIATVEDVKTQKDFEEELSHHLETNEATQPSDSYSMYRKLMDIRNEMLKDGKEETEGLKVVKSALKVVFETAFHSFIKGFLPTVERVRRESTEEKKTYLDGATYIVGAIMGKKKCSNMIACKCGKFVQARMPGAQLAVMMAESMVPRALHEFFAVLKDSVIDRTDNCEDEFECNLTDEISYGDS